MDALEKTSAALEALFQDRFNNSVMVTAAIRLETGEVKLFYPALHGNDRVYKAIVGIVPEDQCKNRGMAGGQQAWELDRFLHGHTTTLTMIVDDAQLKRITALLDEMREERALYPGLGNTRWDAKQRAASPEQNAR